MKLSDNIKDVNKIIVDTMGKCNFLLLALLVIDWVGIFNFSNRLVLIILATIVFEGMIPYLFLYLKVSDNFLKYYMLLSMAGMISALGSNNAIGIYLTYGLVPLLSCLYFDKRFTLNIGILSYIAMAIGVYINCRAKFEVVYLGQTHFETFRDYMIGFTIEYLIIMLFLYQIVSRSQSFFETYYNNVRLLKEENEQQKKYTSIYKNNVSSKTNSAYSIISQEIDNLTPECHAKLTAGHRFLASLQEELMYVENVNTGLNRVLSMLGAYFKVDRIMFFEINPDDETSTTTLQWNREAKNYITKNTTSLPYDEQNVIKELYKKHGYLEIIDSQDHMSGSEFTEYMMEIKLGIQLWLPALKDGEYIGAMCFDRVGNNYSTVEKFLLAEAVGVIATNVNRNNSEAANQAKSDFLSSMSHEIRTPMNAILGMTTVALREETSVEVKKCLDIIKSSAEGLLSIINDILDLSKIESGKVEILPEEYKTLALLNDVVVMANARNVDKGLEIKYEYDENLPASLYGDFVRIKQVMINFITNAIKYTDEGCAIVRLHTTDTGEGKVLLKYEVEDTGQGIKEEDINKLFSSYSQVNQEQNHHKEGTGLGLNISKRLIELMGGKITVESVYGKGSKFSFEIEQPVVDYTPAGTLEDFKYSFENNDEISEYKAEGKKILIVDDNDMNLMIEEDLFEPFGMEIMTANSALKALEIISNNDLDIVFMDRFMPEIDGLEAVKMIRNLEDEKKRKLPVVALTADAIAGVKEEMLEAGMDDFLSKPVELKDVVRVLKRFFD